MVHDPNPVLAEALCLILRADAFLSTFRIVSTTAEDLTIVLKVAPDILIVNPWRVTGSRDAALRPFREMTDKTYVICYSADVSSIETQQLVSMGFRGVVPTTVSGDELVRIVSSVAFGGTYIADIYKVKSSAPVAAAPVAVAAEQGLTEREAEVLHRVALGNSLKEVAAALKISTKTVDTYKTRACHKLGLHSRSDIVRYAITAGWLS